MKHLIKSLLKGKMKTNFRSDALKNGIIILLLSHSFIYSYSQYLPDTEFSILEINEQIGLKSKESYHVNVDSKGYLWICTDLGVYKYDGYNTTHYSIKDGLLSNIIFETYEDYLGRIWFLGKATGLCYYENGKINEYEFNNVIKSKCQLPKTDRKELIVTPKFLYYSINSCGYFKISNKGKVLNVDLAIGQPSLICLENENLIFSYKKTNRPINEVYSSPPLSTLHLRTPDSLITFPQFEIERSGSHNLHYLKYHKKELKGLALLDGFLIDFLSEKIITSSVTNIFKDNNNNVFWVGTKNGLFQLEKNTSGIYKIRPSSCLENYFITSIFCDPLGNTFISTLENGVFTLPKSRLQKLKKPLINMDKNSIIDFAFFKNNIYISTQNSIHTLDNSLSISGNYSLLKNYKDSLLFISNLGLIEDPKLSIKPTLFTRDYLLDEDTLYMSTSYIAKYDINKDSIEVIYNSGKSSTKFENIKHIIKANDEIYFSTINTIFKFKDSTIDILKVFNDKEISDIIYTEKYGFLIASKTKGIYSLKNNKFHKIELPNEFSELKYTTKLFYSKQTNSLLIGTYKGLILFSFDDEKIIKLGPNLGVKSNKILQIKEYDNELYISNSKDIYIIRHQLIDQLLKSNTFTSTDASLNFVLIDQDTLNNSNSIPYFSEFITISASIKDLSTWRNRKYQYQISENNSWKTSLTPEIILNNPKQNFSFILRYLQSNGEWSPIVIRKNFKVQTPWYKSWYFILLYTLTIFIITYLVIRVRLKKRINDLEARNNLLSYQQRLQNARIKPHFVFNVLNSINGHILFKENDKASNYLIKFSHLMRNILDKSGSEIITIEKEEKFLNSFLNLEQLRTNFNFDYEIEIPKEIKKIEIPSMTIQPFVENAIIHGISDKKDIDLIKVIFKRNSINTISVSIHNSSKMTEEQINKWNEFNKDHAVGIIKERLENYKSIYKIHSLSINLESNNMGTTVTLILPILNKWEELSQD